MGVFRWSKDKKNAKKVVQNAAQKMAQKSAQNAAGDEKKKRERRCSFLVEEFYISTRMEGVMVRGHLHGRVNKGDTLFMYHPELPVKAVHVLDIELGPRETVDTAKNQLVDLCLDLQSAEEVERYAVLTSIKPIPPELRGRIIENPRMFGLMMEYGRLYTNSVYMDALLYELCYCTFAVPLYMEKPPIPQPDGTLKFEEGTFVGFRPIQKAGTENTLVFPAFTDEVAIAAWKDAYQVGQPRQVAAMQLPHLIEYVGEANEGLVINPFGPVPVFFPKELLAQVKESEVYVTRYENKEADKTEENNAE